ncbi:hypothetical protein RHSIM_Rhsim04G0134500 [Rhododendron simsii]|uniref:Uncharacterized protein n=1 Tax=Rhododendron simsii TaxID=118357 RepID=A0A834H2H3_RHOSS|nr:hypothetical protein RHSIM_Rhsim04G0134500 [Rhododendron simsii]
MGRSKLMADGIKAYRAEGTRVLGYCKSVDPDVAAERKQNWEEEERYRKREEEEAEWKKQCSTFDTKASIPIPSMITAICESQEVRTSEKFTPGSPGPIMGGCGVGSSSEPYVPTQEDEENAIEEEEEIIADSSEPRRSGKEQIREHDDEDEDD